MGEKVFFIYAIGSLILLLTAGFLYVYVDFLHSETAQIGQYVKTMHHKLERKQLIYTGGGILLALLLLLAGIYFQSGTAVQNLRNAEVAVILAAIAQLDWKEKIIPNVMILIMIGLWVCLSVMELAAAGTSIKTVLLYSAGGALLGVILWVIALLLKNALGMGDVKLIFALGLLYGFDDTYSILLFSIILMAVVSIGLMVAKKATRKSSIPMAPFVLVGFVVNVLMGM